MDLLVGILLPFVVGGIIGACSVWIFYRMKTGEFQSLGSSIIQKAEQEVENLKKNKELELKVQEIEHQRKLENQWLEEYKKLQKEEERIKQREDRLEARVNLLEKKQHNIEKKESSLDKIKERTITLQNELTNKEQQIVHELENLAGLSIDNAKELLLQKISNQVKTDAANLTRHIQQETQEQAERKATQIISTAINRLAVPCVTETTVCTIPLPNDEMKGRIIGREGRNIRALENATGVNFVIDDTPRAVVISGFDPVRKHIAKTALQELILDGRIHPTRIEEMVAKAEESTQTQIMQYGEDAAMLAGVINLNTELIKLLGQLKFRYSYGQNILDHSIGVAYILGMITAELHLNVNLAKRIGLLHDIGKAVSHEVDGSHAMIGYELALKYNEPLEVANGIGSHHEEMSPITIEASLCSAADAISAARPGTRVEALDQYFKRLSQLEQISKDFPGVEKAYALQAGREVRVVVTPDIVDDDGIVNLSRELARTIETRLTYPGKIKVTVIREKRAVEYAV